MRVLDLSTLLPGPLSTKLLQDVGAHVTKVESPISPDLLKTIKPTQNGVGVAYDFINNQKTIEFLDLRNSEDKSKFLELIKETDVLVENFRPGRLLKMGLGYEDLKKINPNIIHCSITGYGYEHPLSQKAAHDLNILALSGYLDYQSRITLQPFIPPIQIADVLTGYHAALSILAYKAQNKSGWLDISMLDSMKHAYTLLQPAENYLNRDIKAEEMPLWGSYPCYRVYQTKDEKYVVLAAVEPHFWQDFCTANGLEDLKEQQFSLDSEVKIKLENLFHSKTREEWALVENDYCLTPVYSYLEAKEKSIID